jgi:pimeloyl-ACP methyl ester carboxylesterase
MFLLVIGLPFSWHSLKAQEQKPLSVSLEDYAYPYEVSFFPLHIEGQDFRMAYMDIKPVHPNGRNVVLLHGKNFFGAYWKGTIKALSDKGFRVIVPDQIGFGKSSKPDIHYSFHLLAYNTKLLLSNLGVKNAVVIGHSMGGMLATRFALMYPEMVSDLILEDPIGLEDYRQLVPYATIESLYEEEMNQTDEGIRTYFKSYFAQYRPEYGEFAEVAIRQKLGGEYNRLAMSSALTYQMIYEQPVCYEFPFIKVRTLLIIGQSDRTVVGKNKVPKDLLPKAGQYPELGRKTAKLIPDATLVEIDNTGHIPHIEAPERFYMEVLKFLK